MQIWKLKIGDIITKINGLAVEQIVKYNLYLTPVSNYETQRKGIKIDMSVRPTIEGIIQGKDELLEKAVEIINSKTSVK